MAEKKKAASAKSEAPKMVGTKEVAKKLGVPPATLRRILRAAGKNTPGEYSRYQWKPEELKDGSKELDKLKKLITEHTADGKKKGGSKKKSKKSTAKKGGSKKKSAPAEDTEEIGDDTEEEIEDEEETLGDDE